MWRHRAQAADQGDDVAEWLTEALGMSCRLVRMAENHARRANDGRGEIGFADAYPFLVISEASLADLNGRLSRPLPMNRFRQTSSYRASTRLRRITGSGSDSAK